MIDYILQVIIIQASFLVVYDVWLRKETFFKWNRAYLLGTLLVSFVLPNLKIRAVGSELTQTAFAVLPEIVLNPSTAVENLDANDFFLNYVPYGIYIGIGVLTILFIYKLSKIFYLIGSGEIIEKDKVKLVLTKYPYSAFSFFNFIFINENILKNKKEIIQHEMVHCRERHTVDLLLVECIKILMWFNPMLYVYQSRITEIHEFISDAQVVQNSNKERYLNTLLGVTFNVQNIGFINQFYKHSLIKKRVVMMTKEKSKQIKLFKYITVVPLLAGLLFYVSCGDSSEAQDVVKKGEQVESKKEVLEIDPMEDTSIPFVKLEDVPKFKGATGSSEELKKDFQQRISKHIVENFDFELSNKLELEPDTYRIYVMFQIDKDGSISHVNAKAPHEQLEAEALRVIESLPELEPGTVDGKTVNVKYTVPIAFKVE